MPHSSPIEQSLIIVLLLAVLLYFKIKSIIKSKTEKQTSIYYFIIGIVAVIISQTVDELKYSHNLPYYLLLFGGLLIFSAGGILLMISKSKE